MYNYFIPCSPSSPLCTRHVEEEVCNSINIINNCTCALYLYIFTMRNRSNYPGFVTVRTVMYNYPIFPTVLLGAGMIFPISFSEVVG